LFHPSGGRVYTDDHLMDDGETRRGRKDAMSEANKAVVRRFFEEAADRGHDDEFIAEDVAYHGPPMIGELRGRAALVQVLEGFRQAFPGFETEIHRLVAEDDLVVVHHTHRGTHQGALMGIPPTGRQIAVQGIEIVRVRDGQVAEFWHLDDFLSLMQQLGVVPAPAAT
jgi:steroid delta-isomerase-like uncharacterized protein